MSTAEQTQAKLDEATRALHQAYRITDREQRCLAVAAAFRLEAQAWADLDPFARSPWTGADTAQAELLSLARTSARRLASNNAGDYDNLAHQRQVQRAAQEAS